MATAVTYDLTHGIATLTLNRADSKNSLSVEVMDAPVSYTHLTLPTKA